MKKMVMVAGVSFFASMALATDAKIELDPIVKDFIPSYRIDIKANIEDKKGVDLARVYFKSSDVENFSFVKMECKKEVCSATLPAPAKTVKSIDYLVLVKNRANEVYKTQIFSAKAKDSKEGIPPYQKAVDDSKLLVKTELKEAPKALKGFSDNVVLDAVESGAKYGVVAGLYNSSTSGAVGATTTVSATSTGTVVATEASLLSSTAMIVGGVAVAGGAVAVASNSGSDDRHSSYDYSHEKENIVSNDDDDKDENIVSNYDDDKDENIVSNYDDDKDENIVSNDTLVGKTYKGIDPSRGEKYYYNVIHYYENGHCKYKEYIQNTIYTGRCSWNVSGDNYRFESDYGAVFSGKISGNIDKFTVTGHWACGKKDTFIMTRQ